MTLREQLALAVRTGDALLLGSLVDRCRFRLGMSYAEFIEITVEASGASGPEIDSLLAEADEAKD